MVKSKFVTDCKGDKAERCLADDRKDRFVFLTVKADAVYRYFTEEEGADYYSCNKICGNCREVEFLCDS